MSTLSDSPADASHPDWQRVVAPETNSTYFVYSKEIQKSPNDDNRTYRLVQLENGLRALLIHDPTMDKTTCIDTTERTKNKA